MRTLIAAIQEAERRKIAIGHFNFANLEQLKAIAHVGMRLNVPVIIGVSEGEREYLGVHHVRDLIDSHNKEHARTGGFQLFLNADHTKSLEKAREAVVNGFDAVLFDGSKLSLDENITQTKEAVRAVTRGWKFWQKNVLVEGELGYIGGASEIREGIPEGAVMKPEDLTKPEDAVRFVRETGVNLLAPAVGNIHGMLARQSPKGDGGYAGSDAPLDIARIKAIKDAVKIPLVLHGASGNTDEDLRAAIDAGISIVHISTELRAAWRKSLEGELAEHPREVSPYKVMPDVLAAMEKVVERHLRLFNRIS